MDASTQADHPVSACPQLDEENVCQYCSICSQKYSLKDSLMIKL